ncbi:MAG: glycosyltransferase family 1 protein [Thermoanaerobaculia bacterium]
MQQDEFELVGLAHAPLHPSVGLAERGLAIELHASPLGVIWQQRYLPRRLARGDIDLFWSPLLTLPRRLPVPGVVTLHDLAVLHHPETLTWRVRLSLLPFLESTVRQAARILTVSHAVESEIAQQWPEAAERIDVAWNGVAADFRPASEDELRAIRQRLGLPDRYVLFVGTVEPRKNLDLLLDAWEALRRESVETPPLLVAGPDGWGSAATHRRIERLKALGLRRLGHLDRADLIAVLQAATLFIMPSLYEGFGLPAAEAMACGVPVMVSDRSSLPEVVGDAGRLFDPDDPAELALAMRDWLESQELLSAARARGLERSRAFTWKRSAELHALSFRRALAMREPAP